MKICFITYNLFNLGGVQRVLSVLSNELVKKYDVEILCLSTEYQENRNLYNLNKKIKVELNNKLTKRNIVFKVISKAIKMIHTNTKILDNKVFENMVIKSYYPKSVEKKIIKFINERKYDVVIGLEGKYSIMLGRISNEISAKTISWQHNSYEAYLKTPKKYYWKQEKWFKEYLGKLDRVILLTKDDKRKYEKLLEKKCTTIYNPLSFTSNCKSDLSSSNLIFVGRLAEEQKGLDFLIKVFSIVVSKHPEWKLNIVGDGKDKKKLLNMIQEANLVENISLYGFSNNVEKIYKDSSIFISTSRWEGFGLVITEAMECGLPIVSFNNSGPKEIIDRNGVNGILVPRYDIEIMAKEIINLIEDKEIMNNLSKESIKRAKDFKVDTIGNEWIKLIEELLVN